MDKKTIILIVSLGILVIFWIPIMTKLGFVSVPEPSPVVTDTTAISSEPVQSNQPLPQPTQSVTQPTTQILSETVIEQQDTTSRAPEQLITVETNTQIITLSSYGGGPISIELKNYKYNDSSLIQMLPDCEKATPEIIMNNGAINLSKYDFTPSSSLPRQTVSDGTYELLYTYENEAGGRINKKYRFYADKHNYDLILTVENKATFGFEWQYSINWNNKLLPTELDIATDYSSMWVMAMQAERETFDDFDDGKFSRSIDAATYWTATKSKYFTAVIIPDSRPANGVTATGLQYSAGEFTAREIHTGLNMNIKSDPAIIDSFTIFVGPIDYDILNEFDNDVADLIDIGTTPFIGWLIKIFAIPILWLLPRMYEYLPNYGFVIILFALMVKVITWPLTKKTIKSMSAMKDLQPKMNELKEKHKNNPQVLNKETMKLYKESGVNPFSGCLPYLPQMPLFFAMFAVFRSTILLRHAPFVLWYDDLSRGAMSYTDPYVVLVILMMAIMFLQQKMTPMSGAQQNKALMYVFPLMLGFFFYKASAGLLIYWTSFSLFSFLEQVIFRRGKKNAEVKQS